MREQEIITIYWTPVAFDQNNESWHMLYSEPVPIKGQILDYTNKDSSMRICPALRDATSQLFTVKSNIDDSFSIPLDIVKEISDLNDPSGINIPLENNKLSMAITRKSEYKNYYHYSYNLSYIYFADQPVVMRMTSPYMPPSSPIAGAFLPPGEFDIGHWYRNLNLEYISPNTSDKFNLKRGDDLFYLEFFTNKKIVFKRYFYTDRLSSIAQEFANSKRYGIFQNLQQRYDFARNAKMKELILSEIKKNVVE